MPLWSVEEWRARIGSSWCALGRPYHTMFTRNRGKSHKSLSLHQVATMVITMMLLIAANLGLCATQGHHRAFMSECALLHVVRLADWLKPYIGSSYLRISICMLRGVPYCGVYHTVVYTTHTMGCSNERFVFVFISCS